MNWLKKKEKKLKMKLIMNQFWQAGSGLGGENM